MNLGTVKWAQRDKTQCRELRTAHVSVTVLTTQNSCDKLPSRECLKTSHHRTFPHITSLWA